MAARRVNLRFRHTPELRHSVEFDIARFEDPGELYRFGWDYIFGNDAVSSDVAFRGFSSENPLVVLQDNVVPGHIMHENLQLPVGGQVGVGNEDGLVFLLVMQWRREGHAEWEWYSADAVDWQTFRANVGEIFAHAVLLVQFNVPLDQNILQDQVPQNVRLLFQTFGNHVSNERTVTEAQMQAFDGPLQLYNFISGAVFGMMAANDFHPINFRGILGNIQGEIANGNLLVQNQTVGGWLGFFPVEGVVIGQLRINAQGQLVLLAIKWRAGDMRWRYYKPQVHQWGEFRSAVREIFAYGVLVAQF